jgi:uncharacterized ferritin-like protein (DUF455 family)
MSHCYSNIVIDIEEGADGLFGLKVTDTNTGAVWWETICESKGDAIRAMHSLFENKAMQDLQEKLNRVRMSK